MPFVDAQRYLKVQTSDLDTSFTEHHDPDDKYSKTSFESFHIAPTSFSDGTKWYHAKYWQSERKRWWLLVIAISVLVVGILAGLIVMLVLTFNAEQDNTGDVEDGEVSDEDAYAEAISETIGIVKRLVRGVNRRDTEAN